MIPILLTGPSDEPVSLSEAKTWLRVDSSEEDLLISALITSARLIVEAQAQILLLEQRWRLVLDCWPPGEYLQLPLRPLISLDGIQIANSGGGFDTLAAESWLLDPAPLNPRIKLTGPAPQPSRSLAGIQIDLTCGFGPAPADVPATLRQAILLLIARWYESRGDASDDAQALPEQIGALIAPWRPVRLS